MRGDGSTTRSPTTASGPRQARDARYGAAGRRGGPHRRRYRRRHPRRRGSRARPAGGAAAPADLLPAWESRPSSGEVGFLGWFRARLAERPIRADRTAGLAREPGGRLDRLDLWMVVVLAAVAPHAAGSGGSASRTRCTSTRSTTRGRPMEFLQALALRDLPQHLRVDPPPPGQVRDGRRDRGLGRRPDGRDERPRRPVRGAAVEPRWDEPRSASAGRRRPAVGRDRRRRPRVRPRRRVRSSASSSGARGGRRWPSTGWAIG